MKWYSLKKINKSEQKKICNQVVSSYVNFVCFNQTFIGLK